MSFSDYIVYADESGDHSLTSIDPQFPVFALAFCLMHKPSYTDRVVPDFLRFKFEFWGHDCVVLHGHEIRKSKGDFNILLNSNTRATFLERLNNVIETADFTIIASVIDKPIFIKRYAQPIDPYKIALRFCMERLQYCLRERGQANCTTHIQVECRGAAEDTKLELEFRRICDGNNHLGKMPNLDIRFMDKKHNSTGLQLADLVAHPIARHVLKPDQANRAFDILKPKLRRGPAGQVKGYGLKVFP
jgi:hypothetical protein